ncbi:hypothetical protein CIL05_07625 [Virgibacillus profundi]|uniref:Uncharacterized protein n=1 Tax=Virgibacillus profundi TaxID=2024555 RepID=A0A2A2IE94_9BACI|nr:hypothetical protein [Virgibacillus profundi]PAV30331.1 hypothetical protein CIL05_07625 [Virgibacillus profundi]PXY54503.1 hypothetical protein CIT14_07710 [Virgibacillus profundi]
MKQIQTIEINLENLETIIIHRQHVGYFELNNITRNLRRKTLKDVSENFIVLEVFMQISSEANTMDSYVEDDYSLKPFERIVSHSDITYFVINYDDGSQEELHLHWHGKNDSANDAQSSVINEATGDLYLAISQTEPVQTYFKEEIEDKRKLRLWKELKED